MVFKNKDKMTTNQLSESSHILRQAMLYPASGFLTQRLQGLHKDVRDQIESKIFKISPTKLIFMLL